MSLQRERPPTNVPGYEPERLLGVGAYGEVWVAAETNTNRRVAIKFYAHRGGLDWSLLSREVEKLAFLSADRYVVQLIGVGWDADPPYYIMEYLEQGSLADRIEQGALPVGEAVELFRDVAVGLLHSHGKGVLHCDLKPANVLLDQDNKPRLADFGQSRLSHEQSPALGTLFYMAPEQADLEAIPDGQWDVYALGALLYCMLTGSPPYRTPEGVAELEQAADLRHRLTVYRRLIQSGRIPTAHRQVARVDRPLAEIIERCLAVDPGSRFPNIQSVLAALEARDAARARRPMTVLGTVGPVLVLAVVSLFAWTGFNRALRQSEVELTRRAKQGSRFAADLVARTVGNEMERRVEAVERVAASSELQAALEALSATAEMHELAEKLSDPEPLHDPAVETATLGPLRTTYRNHPLRLRLQETLVELIPESMFPSKSDSSEQGRVVRSWFVCDARGNSAARVDPSETLGKNYAWRSYFHGGPADYAHPWQRPPPREHLPRTQLSAVFRSQAHGHWIVAVATPVHDAAGEEFLGVVALTVELGQFEQLGDEEKSQYAVLLDHRPGDHTGVILQHSMQSRLEDQLGGMSKEALNRLRITPKALAEATSTDPRRRAAYSDPLAERTAETTGAPLPNRWLVQSSPVKVRGESTGWVVLVEEALDTVDGSIGATLSHLRVEMIGFGLAAVAMVLLVVLGLWGFALRLLREAVPSRIAPDTPLPHRPTSRRVHDATTLPHDP